ncbi:MAG: thioredoxin-dependent thiol peroxidase [Actinomycetota bacterium]|nr:thioredoxin-dependent thiol peroxidase [Actinomycetota bacterium]
MAQLEVGAEAPGFALADRNGETVRLSDLAGKRVLVYFYPKADTPGCTTQAVGLQEVLGRLGDTEVVGISPDPPERLARFAEKHSLSFHLLSDPDHAVAEAYGVWVERSMYGKRYMGIQRSAFLVGAGGRLEQAWYKVSPKDTAAKLLRAVAPNA